MEYTTEDGVVVKEGDRVYNYYDMKPGFIVPNTTTMAPDPWFYVQHDDGTRSVLNGQRICSVEYAKKRGFKGAES
jgi:hypothetical protein